MRSIKVTENVSGRKGKGYVKDGHAGGMKVEHYETKEELSQWRGRLLWEELDVQPLLYPLDYRSRIEAEAVEPESGAVVKVKCCEKMKE